MARDPRLEKLIEQWDKLSNSRKDAILAIAQELPASKQHSAPDPITAPTTVAGEESIEHIRKTLNYHLDNPHPQYGFNEWFTAASSSGKSEAWIGRGQGQSAKLLKELRATLRGRDLEIVEHLWNKRTEKLDYFWTEPVEPKSQKQAIQRLNEKLKHTPVSLSISGEYVTLNRPE